jgi:hypothetical protein
MMPAAQAPPKPSINGKRGRQACERNQATGTSLLQPLQLRSRDGKANIQGDIFRATHPQPSLLPQPRERCSSLQRRNAYANHQPCRCKTLPSLLHQNGTQTGELRPHETTLVRCCASRSIKKRIRPRHCCQAGPGSFQTRTAPSGMGLGWATTASRRSRWPGTEVRFEWCCQIGPGERALRGDCYGRRGEAERQLGGEDAVCDSQQGLSTARSRLPQRHRSEAIRWSDESRRGLERSQRSNKRYKVGRPNNSPDHA